MANFLTNKEIAEQFAAQLATCKVFVAQKLEFINAAGNSCMHILIAQGSKNDLVSAWGRNVQGSVRRTVGFAVERGDFFNAEVGAIVEGYKLRNVQFSLLKRDAKGFTKALNPNAFGDAEFKTLRNPIPMNGVADTFLAIEHEGVTLPIFNRVDVTSDLKAEDIKLWDGSTTVHKADLEEIVSIVKSEEPAVAEAKVGARNLAN